VGSGMALMAAPVSAGGSWAVTFRTRELQQGWKGDQYTDCVAESLPDGYSNLSSMLQLPSAGDSYPC